MQNYHKQTVAEMEKKLKGKTHDYDTFSIVDDPENDMWGYFVNPGQVNIHIGACVYAHPVGKVYMTVRANWDDSCALSKHIESSDVDELIATFNEYKALAESVPETTNWRWYVDRGFKYYQV